MLYYEYTCHDDVKLSDSKCYYGSRHLSRYHCDVKLSNLVTQFLATTRKNYAFREVFAWLW